MYKMNDVFERVSMFSLSICETYGIEHQLVMATIVFTLNLQFMDGQFRAMWQ
jgi:hypothetical protein